MLAFVFVVALLAYSTTVITDNTTTTAASAPPMNLQWDAITAGLEYSGQVGVAEARKPDTGVVARPLPPRDRNGRTVMLAPLPPHSIIGKGAGLIHEEPPVMRMTVTRHR